MAKRILMVDDDEDICEEMKDILESEGYDVTLVFNGIDGERLIRENAWDLVLLDLKLSGQSGYDILRSAREQKTRTRIIVISGRPFIRKYLPGEEVVGQQKKEDILKLADGFINKPFNVEAVLATIKELINT